MSGKKISKQYGRSDDSPPSWADSVLGMFHSAIGGNGLFPNSVSPLERRTEGDSSGGKLKISRKKLNEAERAIAGFYTLQETDPLAEKIRACFLTWTAIRARQEDGRRARAVLDVFYQSGKILDLLRQFSTFAQRIERSTSLEIARVKGYCNYLFFLEGHVKKLMESYTPLPEMERPGQEGIDPDAVADFLKTECGFSASAQKLQAARDTAAVLTRKEKFLRSDYDNYLLVVNRAERRYRWSEEELQALEDLHRALERQYEAISENIRKANEIYTLLRELLPQAWFDSMNYELETCPIQDMEMEELKAYYEERLRSVREKLLDQA